MNEVADTLRKARDVLRERGWAKQNLENEEGQVCARGAIGVARTGSPRHGFDETREAEALARVITEQWADRWFGRSPGSADLVVVGFNDAGDTTQDDVERAFEKAICKAEEMVE